MKSRASFCNLALLRRNLTRSSLIWLAYLLLWLVMLPANLISNGSHLTVLSMQRLVLQQVESSHVFSFFYGAMVAWFLFAYLCRGRSANFFSALPLRRETFFLTNYLSGLLCSLVPNFLIVGLTIFAGFSQDANVILEAGIWFAAHSMTFLFYYSFAVLCAMVVGQIVAIPLLYGVLNLSAVVVESMVRTLDGSLVYGLAHSTDFSFSWLSPLYYFLFEGSGPACKQIWQDGELTAIRFTGWTGLWAVTAVGFVFAAAAFWCYRRRRMEAAGDVMAVRHLRPVFRWCFTLGCTLVIGELLASLLIDNLSTSYFYAISACLLVAAILGYFLSEVILSKSLRVFTKGNLLRCGICCLALAALLIGCRLDVLNIASYVPASDMVQGVILGGSENAVENPEIIRETIALQQEILGRQKETEQLVQDADICSYFPITYILKDGSTVRRNYYLPFDQKISKDPDSLIRQYEDLSNEPAAILARENPGNFTVKDIDYCLITYVADETTGLMSSFDLSTQEAMTLWEDGILEDLKAGSLGKMNYTGFSDSQTYTTINIELCLKDSARSDGDYETTYYGYSIPASATNTLRILKSLGLPEKAFRTVS